MAGKIRTHGKHNSVFTMLKSIALLMLLTQLSTIHWTTHFLLLYCSSEFVLHSQQFPHEALQWMPVSCHHLAGYLHHSYLMVPHKIPDTDHQWNSHLLPLHSFTYCPYLSVTSSHVMHSHIITAHPTWMYNSKPVQSISCAYIQHACLSVCQEIWLRNIKLAQTLGKLSSLATSPLQQPSGSFSDHKAQHLTCLSPLHPTPKK